VREETDAQSFQIEFFNIFGVDRKKVAREHAQGEGQVDSPFEFSPRLIAAEG